MMEPLPWCIIINPITCSTAKMEAVENLHDTHAINYQTFSSYTITDVSYILKHLLDTNNRYFLCAGGALS